MVTPISLALVFNILCLTKNIYAIRRLQKVRSITNSREAKLASPVYKLDGCVLQNSATLTDRFSAVLSAAHRLFGVSCDCEVMARNICPRKTLL